jgi:hypothetical protein
LQLTKQKQVYFTKSLIFLLFIIAFPEQVFKTAGFRLYHARAMSRQNKIQSAPRALNGFTRRIARIFSTISLHPLVFMAQTINPINNQNTNFKTPMNNQSASQYYLFHPLPLTHLSFICRHLAYLYLTNA